MSERFWASHDKRRDTLMQNSLRIAFFPPYSLSLSLSLWTRHCQAALRDEEDPHPIQSANLKTASTSYTINPSRSEVSEKNWNKLTFWHQKPRRRRWSLFAATSSISIKVGMHVKAAERTSNCESLCWLRSWSCHRDRVPWRS